MDSSDNTPNRGVPAPVFMLIGFVGFVLLLVALEWETDPDDFAEDEWSDSALADVEPGAEPTSSDPLSEAGLLPVGEVDPEAELPGPEAITIDEFGYSVPEDDPNHLSWGAAFTNSHPDYFASFAIELTSTSESGAAQTMSYRIGASATTVLNPGESDVYGGSTVVYFPSEPDTSIEVTAAIIDPLWYMIDPEADGGGEAPPEKPVAFETVSAEFGAEERYLHVTVEARSSLDTAFQQGAVIVFYDGDGNIVGGGMADTPTGDLELPPGESVRTFVLWYRDLPADADLARTRFFPDAGFP